MTDPDKPEVVVLVHDLLSVLEGHTLSVATTDGGEVTLRLFAPGEFQRMQHAVLDATDPELRPIGPPDPYITFEKAEELTRPWPADWADRLRTRMIR